MIQDIISQAMIAYHEHIEKRFEEIPVGEFLCVHDDVLNGDKLDPWKMTFVVESHIMAGMMDCDVKVRRTVFGPKTEEIQAAYALKVKVNPNG